MLAQFSRSDLVLLVAALANLRQDSPSTTATSVSPSDLSPQGVEALLSRITGLVSAIDAKRADDGEDEWSKDFGATSPTLERISALAEEAIGEDNQDLRRALLHYGTLRAHGPTWIAALRAVPGFLDTVPPAIRDQMVWFLGRYAQATGA